jgi:hypothetical protein
MKVESTKSTRSADVDGSSNKQVLRALLAVLKKSGGEAPPPATAQQASEQNELSRRVSAQLQKIKDALNRS